MAARRGAALSLAVLLLLLTASAQECNVTGVWQSVGSSDPVTVLEHADRSLTATAQSGFTNATGRVLPNGTTVYLDCCLPGGIYGSINAACTLISWADGAGSEWSRPAPPVPKNVTLSNILPRLDDTGEILRVQDGCLANFGGTWYLYGARYQCCPVAEQPACYQQCGWRNTTFAVYSSPDLQTWHLENDNIFPIVTQDGPHSNTRNAYFEPCVLYSKPADHYALWFLNTNTKAVAVSDSPIGPFESVSWDTGLAQGSDSYFWVDETDPDGTVYVKHNGPPPPGETRGAHYVGRLAPDLLSVLPNQTSPAMLVPALPVPPTYQGAWPSCSEGGGIFSTNGRWYVMAAVCCCFCANGANAFVWVSETGPLGPYVLQNSTSSSGLSGDIIPFNVSSGKYLTGAQQFSVAPIPLANGTVVPMYIGQRFGSADDGLKCHDYQYWTPLFADAGTGIVAELGWVDEWTVEINTYPTNGTR
jgi:hypothetical protein